MRNQVEDLVGRIIIWGCISTTLLVSPWWTLDPINPIKAVAVSTSAFALLAVVLTNQRHLSFKLHRSILWSCGFFIGWLLIVFLLSPASKTQQIFGASGRNTGLITYLSLTILLVSASLLSKREFAEKFIWMAVLIGSISGLYGLLQSLNLDPLNWENPYSPVIGFLGNPDFQSALLGMVSVILFALLINRKLQRFKQVLLALLVVMMLYVIHGTHSQQGLLIFLIGAAVVCFLNLRSIKKAFLNVTYISISILGLILIVLGSLNKGPLANLLHKVSVTYRGDYWRAAWQMTLHHPIFGVGLDNYGSWYRRSRTLEATIRRGPNIVSNTAHNVLLDLSSNGGFILLAGYLIILGLVVRSIIKFLRRSTDFDGVFAALVGGWVAFQAQSIISINQIGLAIWGWVLSGLIIGYEINTRNPVSGKSEASHKKVLLNSKLNKISAATSLAFFGGIIFGSVIGVTPYFQSAKLKSALDSHNAQLINSAAYLKPLNSMQMVQVASILSQNKLDAQALSVLTDAVKAFPDNYDAWHGIAGLNNASPSQVAEATAQLKRLDPHNPELK